MTEPSVDTGAVWHDWRRTYARRNLWLLGMLAFWVLVLAWRMLDVMVVSRADHVERFRLQAIRTGTLPALRGRILDQNGLPLAWSERRLRLVYLAPEDTDLVAGDMAYIRRVFASPSETDTDTATPPMAGGADVQRLATAMGDLERVADLARLQPGSELVVLDRVSGDFGPALAGLVRHDRWRLVSVFARRHGTRDPSLLTAIGQTRLYGQKEVGVSGWEREHDQLLRGTDARYTVMVDRWGNWIPGTWKQIRDPQSGRDWTAPVSLYPPPPQPAD